MAGKDETSIGSQILLAVIILVLAWILLKFILGVVVRVATTLVVLGAIVALIWFFLRNQQDKA